MKAVIVDNDSRGRRMMRKEGTSFMYFGGASQGTGDQKGGMNRTSLLLTLLV